MIRFTGCQSDVVFLLDQSGSIDYAKDWRMVSMFLYIFCYHWHTHIYLLFRIYVYFFPTSLLHRKQSWFCLPLVIGETEYDKSLTVSSHTHIYICTTIYLKSLSGISWNLLMIKLGDWIAWIYIHVYNCWLCRIFGFGMPHGFHKL